MSRIKSNMIERIKESVYDWYVLNIREFYKSWIENMGARIREVTDMPLDVYKECGFKETFLDCWQLPYVLLDGKFMNSSRRVYDRAVQRFNRRTQKLSLETNLIYP